MKEGRQVRSAGPTCGPAPGVRLQEQLIHVPRAEGLWGSKTQTCHLMWGTQERRGWAPSLCHDCDTWAPGDPGTVASGRDFAGVRQPVSRAGAPRGTSSMVPCGGPIGRCHVAVPCGGPIEWCRVAVPCGRAVWRCRVAVLCGRAVWRCRVAVPCGGPVGGLCWSSACLAETALRGLGLKPLHGRTVLYGGRKVSPEGPGSQSCSCDSAR